MIEKKIREEDNKMDLRKLENSVANLAGEAGKRAMDISEKAAKTISKSAENIDIQKVGEIASNASKEVQKPANKSQVFFGRFFKLFN